MSPPISDPELKTLVRRVKEAARDRSAGGHISRALALVQEYLDDGTAPSGLGPAIAMLTEFIGS